MELFKNGGKIFRDREDCLKIGKYLKIPKNIQKQGKTPKNIQKYLKISKNI